jgi:hypothetical protein
MPNGRAELFNIHHAHRIVLSNDFIVQLNFQFTWQTREQRQMERAEKLCYLDTKHLSGSSRAWRASTPDVNQLQVGKMSSSPL